MRSYDENKRAICPHCKGTKREETLKEVPGPQKYISSQEPCHICKGEGIVDKIIIYKPIS